MLLRIFTSDLQTLTRDEKRTSAGTSVSFTKVSAYLERLSRAYSVHYTIHNDQNIQCRKIGHLISPDAPVQTSNPKTKAKNSSQGESGAILQLMRLGAQ